MVIGQAIAYACLLVIRAAWCRLRACRARSRCGRSLGLLGRTPAEFALPCHRRDLLVRGPGAPAAALGSSGADRVAMTGPRPRLSRPDGARVLAVVHAVLAILGFDVMRYVLRVVLPLSLAFTGVLRRAVPRSDDPRFAPPRVCLRFARAAVHVDRLRDVRDGRVRVVADARREHRRLLPLHADEARHADRPRRLIGARDRRDDVRRRLGGGGHPATPTRSSPSPAADLERCRARPAARRDRRAGACRERHQRLHGRALARELGSRGSAGSPRP